VQKNQNIMTNPQHLVIRSYIPALEKAIAKIKKEMESAAKELDFYEAARLRDEMFRYQEILKGKLK
jgi:excinuclease ABC subunit B